MSQSACRVRRKLAAPGPISSTVISHAGGDASSGTPTYVWPPGSAAIHLTLKSSAFVQPQLALLNSAATDGAHQPVSTDASPRARMKKEIGTAMRFAPT